MLPSQKRLNRQQFTTFISSPTIKVVFNRLGTLKYLIHSDLGCSVVTSSKYEKKAVVRNKVRRRIYSLIAKEKISFSGVLYISKYGYTMEFAEITQLFNELVQKITKNTR